MKTVIQQRARELGFDACRVTTTAPPADATRFQQWLADQRHGTMDYLARNAAKRTDPQRVLPGAHSVVCLAASYSVTGLPHHSGQTLPVGRRLDSSDVPPSPDSPMPPPHEPTCLDREGPRAAVQPWVDGNMPSLPVQGRWTGPASEVTALQGEPPPVGVIARYARFADYHEVLADALRKLARFLDELGGPGTRSLWYVDTGPLLERDLAQRAGLGFVGKHTNLIHRQLGNWMVLAEIITTLPLEPDPPEPNRCGSCSRCLTACPTSAITAPFQLDARRCISYLTIELKGPIPVHLRPAVGNHIFGCDDCLAVCPWNRFAREGNLMKQHARDDLAAPDLVELLALDENSFKGRFAGTPILRAKRRGFLRNVCVALGNVGDDRVLPSLDRAASDPEPLIAEHARWAIDRIRIRQGLPCKG